jgi:hypothetical protein
LVRSIMYFDMDELAPPATMSDAHREWHWNTGIPMGTPGCPQDACHPVDDYEDWVDPRADDTEADPEDYADLDAMLADEAALPDPWMEPDAFDPPFW